MMADFSHKSPGVYREEIFLAPEPLLPTGVPGFVGFADGRVPAGLTPNTALAVNRKAEFVTRPDAAPGSYLADAVAGFFDNGGGRCYVVPADPSHDREAALKTALASLAPLEDLDLVCVPDAMGLRLPNGGIDSRAAVRVQSAALTHCANHGGRLAILDALPQSDAPAVLAQRQSLATGQSEPVNGALYFPWLKDQSGRLVPPAGHVAGIIARTDAAVGVFKAPANAEILGVLDIETQIDGAAQGDLNPEGVNCLRAFPGRGIRVWGARTLSRDLNWRYVNVRRLFLTVGRWIDRNMIWTPFEPGDQRLWVRIERELGAYLTGLWTAGALQGQTPEEAFYVKCDAENNPAATREVGQVIAEVGLAPLSPAEFVVVRITLPITTT
jgi:Bacteriophage tail sheath protein